jgi:hypothetical protein
MNQVGTGPICKNCGIHTEEVAYEKYECDQCGLMVNSIKLINDSPVNPIMKVIGTDGRKYTVGNSSSDYRQAQIKHNRAVLCNYNDKYNGPKINIDILDEAAKNYSMMQQIYSNVTKKDFVRRGSVKRQILASLIFNSLIRRGQSRKRSDVADFLGLQDEGFGEGDSQVREIDTRLNLDLIAEGNLDIDFTTRYLKALGIDTKVNINFVVGIVKRANDEGFGIHSFLNSKIAGAIYRLIRELGYKYSNAQIEDACDSCKKSTFDKFCTVIENNKEIFADVINTLRTHYKLPLLEIN